MQVKYQVRLEIKSAIGFRNVELTVMEDDFFVFIMPRDLGFSSVQLLSHVRLFVTLWIAARQASLSITNSQSSLRLPSIESVMPSSHLILCHRLLFLPSVFPNIRVFSSESVLCIRWSKDWSFSFSISPSNEYSGLISFMMDWFDLLADQTWYSNAHMRNLAKLYRWIYMQSRETHM